MTRKNAAEEADKRDPDGGRIVCKGTITIGATREESGEDTGPSYQSAFGGAVTVNEKPEQWWSKDNPVDPLPTAVPRTMHYDPPRPDRSPLPRIVAVETEDVHDLEIRQHGKIAACLVHALKVGDEQASATAARLMNELFGIKMADNPMFKGSSR